VAKFFVSKNTFACLAVFKRLSDKLKKNGIGIWREERSLRDLLLGGIYCPAIESEGMQNVFSSAISTSEFAQ